MTTFVILLILLVLLKNAPCQEVVDEDTSQNGNEGGNINNFKNAMDIILEENEKGDNADLIEGDIMPSENYSLNDTEDGTVNNESDTRNVIIDRVSLWSGRTLVYVFGNTLSQTQKEFIRGTMDLMEQQSCIKFLERSKKKKKKIKQKYFVKINIGQGCWSFVGKIKSKKDVGQELKLSRSCSQSRGTVMHELLHALGFEHEHARSDRDQYVKIYWENIKKGGEDQFQKYDREEFRSGDLLYDYGSVMHYGSTYYSKNPNRYRTIVPIADESGRLGMIGQNIGMSAGDVNKLNVLYDCATDSSVTIWSSWSPFSPCLRKRKKVRQRFCVSQIRTECFGANKKGIISEEVPCTQEERDALLDGHWGQWSSWRECSIQVGIGDQTRHRECDNPSPKNKGSQCIGNGDILRKCRNERYHGKNYCNFESNGCIWLGSSSSHNYIFKRANGLQHRTEKTGPAFGHTYKSYSESFVLAHRSGSSVSAGEQTMMFTPYLRPTEVMCFTFWYHMNGQDIDKLEVLKRWKAEGDNDGDERGQTLLTIDGHQGDVWIPGQVEIRRTPYHFKILLRATCGDGKLSDIAIDDTMFFKRPCNSDENERNEDVPAKTNTQIVAGVSKVGCVRTYDDVFLYRVTIQNPNSEFDFVKSCAKRIRRKVYDVEYFARRNDDTCAWSTTTVDNSLVITSIKRCNRLYAQRQVSLLYRFDDYQIEKAT